MRALASIFFILWVSVALAQEPEMTEDERYSLESYTYDVDTCRRPHPDAPGLKEYRKELESQMPGYRISCWICNPPADPYEAYGAGGRICLQVPQGEGTPL